MTYSLSIWSVSKYLLFRITLLEFWNFFQIQCRSQGFGDRHFLKPVLSNISTNLLDNKLAPKPQFIERNIQISAKNSTRGRVHGSSFSLCFSWNYVSEVDCTITKCVDTPRILKSPFFRMLSKSISPSRQNYSSGNHLAKWILH